MEIELNNITLRKSSEQFELGGFFGFRLNNYSHEHEITLYCEDRKEHLIEGLTHELTEMTIKKVLIEFGYEIESERFFLISKGNKTGYFKVHHLVTVLSLAYYGIQLPYSEVYESMLKTHKNLKNGLNRLKSHGFSLKTDRGEFA